MTFLLGAELCSRPGPLGGPEALAVHRAGLPAAVDRLCLCRLWLWPGCRARRALRPGRGFRLFTVIQ